MIRAILNVAAGGGTAAKRARPLLDRLRQQWPDLEVVETTGPGHATELAHAARREGADGVLSIGGDGTLFEVVNGLMRGQGQLPALGLLPLGTGNSFGKDIGIQSVDEAMTALLGGSTRPVDLVRIDGDVEPVYSINIVGIGFTAAAGSLTNRRFKSLGALGYVCAVVIEVGRLNYPSYRYRLDGGAWVDGPTTMVSFCNSGFTGGDMNMAPGAVIDDGLIDAIHIGPLSRGRFLATFPKIFQGTHVQIPEISQQRAQQVEFDLDGPLDMMIDGEIIHMRPTTLTSIPGALRVFA